MQQIPKIKNTITVFFLWSKNRREDNLLQKIQELYQRHPHIHFDSSWDNKLL